MSNKKLTILGIIAVIMVVWAVLQSRVSQKSTVVLKDKTHLVQGLNPAQITKIQVDKGASSVELVRKGNEFVVAQKDNYKAKIKSVNELINNVLDVKTRGELLTSNPDNFDELQVADVNSAGTVKFFDKEDKLITGIVLGKRMDTGFSAVRKVTENDVHTTEDYIFIQAGPMDYIENKLFEVAADKIVKVNVSYQGGRYEMTSSDSGINMTTAIPTGKMLKSADYEQVFKVLSSLNFSDVLAEANAKDLKFYTKYQCTLDDSTVYMIDVAKKDDKYFIKCSSKFTDLSQISIDKNESEEELKKKEVKLLARDNAVLFKSACAGWVYEIPSHKGENMVKKLTDLIEDIPAPEPKTVEDPNEVTL